MENNTYQLYTQNAQPREVKPDGKKIYKTGL